jgi:hypothetical protein
MNFKQSCGLRQEKVGHMKIKKGKENEGRYCKDGKRHGIGEWWNRNGQIQRWKEARLADHLKDKK